MKRHNKRGLIISISLITLLSVYGVGISKQYSDYIAESEKQLEYLEIQNESINIELGNTKTELDINKENVIELTDSITEIKETNTDLIKQIEELKQENQELKNSQATRSNSRTYEQPTSKKGDEKGIFLATAYDLSYNSCGKYPSHPYYGITASGVNLKGHTLESARAIAVDPSVIPLGSKVQLEFDPEYSHLNAVYTAVDTGGAIKGRRIDVFHGSSNVANAVYAFGRRDVKVTVL